MAKVELNTALKGFHGKIDSLVFKRYGRKIVVTRMPRFSGRWSKKQQAARRRFGLASAYAQQVLENAAELSTYARAAKARQLPVRAVAIADFLNAPVVKSIDASRYTARVGDQIRIEASDDFEVTVVEVVLRDSTGREVERGQAKARRGGWVYVATASREESRSMTIEVTAIDRPGNRSVKTASVTLSCTEALSPHSAQVLFRH